MMPTGPHSSVFPAPELDRLFLRNYDRLLAFSRKNCRRLGDAEDFVHEAYLRSRRRWNAVRISEARPEAYLFRALRWALADALRRKRRETVLDPAELETQLRARSEGTTTIDAEIPPEDRNLFRSLLAGRTKDEMCRELHVSPGALAVRICRAKKKLEACLGV
jgi:RNA polymerase sigma factor (sigma-70 family)